MESLMDNSGRNVASTQKRDKKFRREELLEREKIVWTRSSPAEPYYLLGESNNKVVYGSQALQDNFRKFYDAILMKARETRANHPKYASLPRNKPKIIRKKHEGRLAESSSSSASEYESDFEDHGKEELEQKIKHPLRLHPELWFNERGEMNDGRLCRCSAKSRQSGIRHNIYAGEGHLPPCDPNSNNADRLYHYRITISPHTNFVVHTPTIIEYDNKEFIFEGFSIFSHKKLEELPPCKVFRFNTEYTILYYEEKFPQNMTIKELEGFSDYLFKEILEMVDLDFKAVNDSDGCPRFHFMPRFVRKIPGNGKEILSMNEVIKYLLKCYKPLVRKEDLKYIMEMSLSQWQRKVEKVQGMIVTYPGKKPASLRVDQLDWDQSEEDATLQEFNTTSRTSYSMQTQVCRQSSENKYSGRKKCWSNRSTLPVGSSSTNPRSQSSASSTVTSSSQKPNWTSELSYPKIIHFGIRPPQLIYARIPKYNEAWRQYLKCRHLLANMTKPTYKDKQNLDVKVSHLQKMYNKSEQKRNVTVNVSSKHFYKTGIMCDIVQHAMIIPVLVSHLRFHCSLDVLEKRLDYKFKNKHLLQLALTHPSYRENFGTNPDHTRNSLSNCGIRQPVSGDRKSRGMNTQKQGINSKIKIMSRLGKSKETESIIRHNLRLQFLGNAVLELVVYDRLFRLFPSLEEGGLSTYQTAILQNQHLSKLAETLLLQEFMQYAHEPNLCQGLQLKHAMANCFEALMGALFLDGGIEVADRVFGTTFYKADEDCKAEWFNTSLHPLQEQEPQGDRYLIPHFEFLQKLTKFEDMTGLHFNHIRLLARAFTKRSVGFTHLTLGSNERLEFLGHAVLQLLTTDFLYKRFPEHREGHLTLLRMSLVNNRMLANICNDLGMTEFALYANPRAKRRIKDRADFVEALLAAIFIDQGLEHCRVFCEVCIFPRLSQLIKNQDWYHPKSKLQECCITLRTKENGSPQYPVYKVVNIKGPGNKKEYEVAVYFRGEMLASAFGSSIKTAQNNAAMAALKSRADLFPQLDHQKRVLSKSTYSLSEAQTKTKNKRKKTQNGTKIEQDKSLVREETMSNEGTLSVRVEALPLAYHTCKSPESRDDHLKIPINGNHDKPGKSSENHLSQHMSQVSESQSRKGSGRVFYAKELPESETIEANANQDLEPLSKANNSKKRLFENQLKYRDDKLSIKINMRNKCRETVSPVKNSASRLQYQHRNQCRETVSPVKNSALRLQYQQKNQFRETVSPVKNSASRLQYQHRNQCRETVSPVKNSASRLQYQQRNQCRETVSPVKNSASRLQYQHRNQRRETVPPVKNSASRLQNQQRNQCRETVSPVKDSASRFQYQHRNQCRETVLPVKNSASRLQYQQRNQCRETASPVKNSASRLQYQHRNQCRETISPVKNSASRLQYQQRNQCRETVSPVKNSASRLQYQHRNQNFMDKNYKIESQQREYAGKCSMKHSDNRYQPYHKQFSESRPHGDYFEGKTNGTYSHSTSKSRSSNRNSNREQTPTKSMGRRERSKSPEDIKQTFMNILYGDKNTSYKNKDTASRALIDFVFNEGNKSQQQ